MLRVKSDSRTSKPSHIQPYKIQKRSMLKESGQRGLIKFLFLSLTPFTFFFLFWNVSSFGQPTNPQNLISDKSTDKDWLTLARGFGLSDDDVRSKLLLVKSELDLTQGQTNEIEKLILKMTNEEMIARGLHNDEEAVGTLPADEQDKEAVRKMSADEKKRCIQINIEHEQELKKVETDVMNEVATVRNMLGNKDLDFQYWLFEEMIIYGSEGMAYLKDHNYSPDDLTRTIIARIQKTPNFKQFKTIKTKELSSEKEVQNYFDIRENLIKKRVLFQGQLYGHLSESYIQPKTSKNFREQIVDESEELGRQLKNIK